MSQPESVPDAKERGLVDFHCHILPGLDDGAVSDAEALEMARLAERDGIETIIATPHVFRGRSQGFDLSAIDRKCEGLNGLLKASGVAVSVVAGAEVHVSHDLIQEIRKNRDHLVIHRSSFISLEFPPEHVPWGTKQLFFEVMNEGLTPIIAHPERNIVFRRKPRLLYELIQMGSLAQANSGSFSGLFGREAEEAVKKFLEWNLIHFIGSDAHNSGSFAPQVSEAAKLAEGIVGRARAWALVRENPAAILKNDFLQTQRPVSPQSAERSLKIMLPAIFRSKKNRLHS